MKILSARHGGFDEIAKNAALLRVRARARARALHPPAVFGFTGT